MPASDIVCQRLAVRNFLDPGQGALLHAPVWRESSMLITVP